MSVDELLDCGWRDFQAKVMQATKNELIKALKKENSNKGQRRTTFIMRMNSRIAQLAKEEQIKKLKG